MFEGAFVGWRQDGARRKFLVAGAADTRARHTLAETALCRPHLSMVYQMSWRPFANLGGRTNGDTACGSVCFAT